MDAVDFDRLRWGARFSLYCPADVQVQGGGLFVLGPPSVVAAGLLGNAIGNAIGNARARRLAAPQWRIVGQGDVSLAADQLVARWPGNVDVSVPFRTITSWKATASGVEITRVGWAPLRVDTSDPQGFAGWFGYLANGKTWRPPVLQSLQVECPVVSWCQQDPRFTFGLPEGWLGATPDWFARAGQYMAPDRVVAAVCRYDGPIELTFWVVQKAQPDPRMTQAVIEQGADEVAADMAMRSRGSFADPIELADVGGERATIFHLSRGAPDPLESVHIFVTHDGGLYNGTLRVPSQDDQYRGAVHELHTMLATWHWYG
jgi:hypothetical protein